MRRFLFEDKEYRINPKFKRKRNEQDSAQSLARFLRQLGPRSQGYSRSGAGVRQVDTRQKCVVKMQYSNSREAHNAQLEHYLVREGTDIDGGRAKLYGNEFEEYRKNMDSKNFRIFLSPQSEHVELKDLTEKFVKKLEQQTGYIFCWQAANHYNTAHPHAHLLINGKDRHGKDVIIPRDVVKTFMREYARDICTSQIGGRTLAEIAIDKEKELSALRFTRLDETIRELCGGTLQVNLRQIKNAAERQKIRARFDSLRKMNLCIYRDGAYKLSPRWEEDLRANGRYNVYLGARRELQYSTDLKVFSGEHGTVTGKVTKIYQIDEEASDSHAVILEGLDGKAYFVPLLKKSQMYNSKEKTALKEGEVVAIKAQENQRGRLTPFIFKREKWQIHKEIQRDGHIGSLAAAVKQGLAGGLNATKVKSIENA